jgi:hypothetical protein
MPHILTIPTDNNGVILDASMSGVIAQAMAIDPFGFEDVFLYSHGWSNDADYALDEYNTFSTGFAREVLIASKEQPGIFPAPPREPLGVGIHWPSEITEDATSPLNYLQLATFFTMRHRADTVGRNAVYSILRLILKARAGLRGTRFLLVGHSFGCKVMCAALQDIYTDIDNHTIPLPAGTSWRVVLLEPAMDQDNLEDGDIYGNIHKFNDLRLLMTTSQKDECLTKWYPDASRIANLFHLKNPTPALGAEGPTAKTIADFGGASDPLTIDQDFPIAAAIRAKARLAIADLTPIHAIRATNGQYPNGGLAGSHSDINFPELYNLISGFMFS